MNYYLDLYPPSTYDAYWASGRSVTGFRKRHAKPATHVAAGDRFFCYLIRLSRWVGIQEVIEGPFEDTTPLFDENELPKQDAAVLVGLLEKHQSAGVVYPVPTLPKPRLSAKPGAIVVPEKATVPLAESPSVEGKDSTLIQALLAEIEAQMKFKLWLPKGDRMAVLQHCQPKTRAEVGVNRLLAGLRHICTWALARRPPIIDRHPFKQHGETVVHLETAAERPRRRRLAPGEEDRLRKHAGPHLRGLIVAALTIGCRLGELLSLQWSQIRYDEKQQARGIVLPGEKTKTSEDRTIPVGPTRAEREMVTLGPMPRSNAVSLRAGTKSGSRLLRSRRHGARHVGAPGLGTCISTICVASSAAGCWSRARASTTCATSRTREHNHYEPLSREHACPAGTGARGA